MATPPGAPWGGKRPSAAYSILNIFRNMLRICVLASIYFPPQSTRIGLFKQALIRMADKHKPPTHGRVMEPHRTGNHFKRPIRPRFYGIASRRGTFIRTLSQRRTITTLYYFFLGLSPQSVNIHRSSGRYYGCADRIAQVQISCGSAKVSKKTVEPERG